MNLRRRPAFTIAVLLASTALVACASAVEEEMANAVTGTVIGPPDAELPAGSVLSLALADITEPNEEATILGEATEIDIDDLPAEYELIYDPSAIDAARDYGVLAEITGDDDVLYTSYGVPVAIDGGVAKEAVGVRVLPPQTIEDLGSDSTLFDEEEE